MQNSFEQVVHTYSETIYNTAYLYVRKREVAEDITQEVLLKFYKVQADFRGEASLKTYLTRMTINACYDYERSWKNKTQQWIETLTLKSDENLEASVEGQETKSELIEAISKLKPKLKEVIILYYFEELLIREIADVLQCNENTVQTRLSRARVQLKHVMNREDGEWNEKTAIK